MDALSPSPTTSSSSTTPKPESEGKIGMAILLWLLGVPGGIVLLYLLLAH
jgi:hypothetical protein